MMNNKQSATNTGVQGITALYSRLSQEDNLAGDSLEEHGEATAMLLKLCAQ